MFFVWNLKTDMSSHFWWQHVMVPFISSKKKISLDVGKVYNDLKIKKIKKITLKSVANKWANLFWKCREHNSHLCWNLGNKKTEAMILETVLYLETMYLSFIHLLWASQLSSYSELPGGGANFLLEFHHTVHIMLQFSFSSFCPLVASPSFC